MNQLSIEISNLEQKPTNPNNQAELNSKKQQLKELQDQEKTLFKSLPLDTQISILQKEIKELENKPFKTKAEQALLDGKKKELEELLKKQNKSNAAETKTNDRTGLYIGCGIVGTLILLFTIVLVRNRQKRKLKK